MGAFKDELNRMGFIRVDFILSDVGTEGSEGSPSCTQACARVRVTCSASDDGMGRRRLRREVGAMFPKIIIPSVSNYNSISITPGWLMSR